VPGGASYTYAPIINVLMQSDVSALSAGVEYFAVDSTVYTSDTVDNFVEQGSPRDGTLWTLDIAANGPVASPSGLDIDFELNPLALDEITFPTSFLITLPGYSPSLTHAQLAPLINSAINSAIRGAFSIDSSGVASISDFSFLPTGTMFTPLGGDVVYADGVNTGVAVPEPSTITLVLTGLMVAGMLYRRQHA
jgi:hypothetical protein